jgi:hypothetical protein
MTKPPIIKNSAADYIVSCGSDATYHDEVANRRYLEATHCEYMMQLVAKEPTVRLGGGRNAGTSATVVKLPKFDGPTSLTVFP